MSSRRQFLMSIISKIEASKVSKEDMKREIEEKNEYMKRKTVEAKEDEYEDMKVLSNPKDLLQAQIRIRRELRLSYFEIQKTNRPNPPRPNQNNQPIRRPNFQPPRCTFCGRIGHSNNECRSRQNSQNNSQNFNDTRNFSSYQNFNNAQNNGFQRQNFSPNNNYQNARSNDQQRPQLNQNNSQIRPSVIHKNPNFSNDRQRAHFVNYEHDYVHDYTPVPIENYHYEDFSDNNYYSPTDYYNSFDEQTDLIDSQDYQDFLTVPNQNHPPDNVISMKEPLSQIQNQIQTLNSDDINPSLNFPDQEFL
ncbi:GATA zinc finger domain-containing protein 14-like [Diabrotica virgifera virgifera]|uniref:CCHC-type domain-containing protein n=1 Tax=Diabrotica virgifera virgifera TaxID=50390 RepID=A0ABM5L936_DIAVI|nr:GATA zinc finger domain-containing protein 14-like [Diabrotica virgifera virgifera]